MTLGELLKDKKLPVKVKRRDGELGIWREIIDMRGDWAIGYCEDNTPCISILTGIQDWELYQEPMLQCGVMKNEPAFPMYSEIGNLHATGLTKREYFAGLAMQGLLCNASNYSQTDVLAVDALKFADALIAELEKG